MLTFNNINCIVKHIKNTLNRYILSVSQQLSPSNYQNKLFYMFKKIEIIFFLIFFGLTYVTSKCVFKCPNCEANIAYFLAIH